MCLHLVKSFYVVKINLNDKNDFIKSYFSKFSPKVVIKAKVFDQEGIVFACIRLFSRQHTAIIDLIPNHMGV